MRRSFSPAKASAAITALTINGTIMNKGASRKPNTSVRSWASGGSAERVTRDGERVLRPWREPVARTTPPLLWLHPSFDRSPTTLEYVSHAAWGPLANSIFGLSYGTGELYLVLRDDVTRPDGTVVSQGGAVKLGVQLPTGILDAHVHPKTGDLYCCGLFGWSGDRTDPGGFGGCEYSAVNSSYNNDDQQQAPKCAHKTFE